MTDYSKEIACTQARTERIKEETRQIIARRDQHDRELAEIRYAREIREAKAL